MALKWGLPQRARGIRIASSKLNSIHKLAVKAVGQPKDSPLLKIQSEANPVRRIALALEAPKDAVSRIEFSQLVTDAYAGLSVSERYILSRQLLPVLSAHDRVTAATYELLSEPLTKLYEFTLKVSHNLTIRRNRASHWNDVLAKVSQIGKSKTWNAPQLCNILYTLFAVENEHVEADSLCALDELWHGWFHPVEEIKEAA